MTETNNTIKPEIKLIEKVNKSNKRTDVPTSLIKTKKVTKERLKNTKRRKLKRKVVISLQVRMEIRQINNNCNNHSWNRFNSRSWTLDNGNNANRSLFL